MAEFKPIEQIVRIESNRKGFGVDVSFVKELVRCKDCRHRIRTEYAAKYDPEYYCELDTDDIYELGRKADDPNWFCADAERME